MNRHVVQLIARGAINRMGNMLYDYGNSVWLASMGTVGRTVLGIYQISEPSPHSNQSIWWRDLRPFFPSQDFDDDRLGLWSPLFGHSSIRNDRWMIVAPIVANIVQAIAFAFLEPPTKLLSQKL